MAASIQNLKFNFRKQKIIQVIKENLNKQPTNATSKYSKGLIAVDGTSFFVWDAHSACILHCSFGALTAPNVDGDAGDSNGYPDSMNASTAADAPQNTKYQRLVCSNPPKFDVSHLILSPTRDYIALYGQQGLTVVHVPVRKSRLGEFDDGKESIMSRSVNVGEYELGQRHNIRVLQVSWHPGSEQASAYVSVLMSHNCIYTYDILHPTEPVETLSLGRPDLRSDTPASMFDTALGEIAVSFDFGAAVELRRKPKKFTVPRDMGEHCVWPVYVLKGNGDVLMAYSHLSTTKLDLSEAVTGPLTMYPPAEDNYGTDACSIACLPYNPEVLVIATCTGCLYHCVVLVGQEEDEDPTQTTIQGYILPRQMSLYVYEVIELEFSLVSPSAYKDDVIEDFSYPVRLMKDMYVADRYHCCHSAGVHTIAVVWLNSLDAYSRTDKGDNDLGDFCLDQSSIVEHLICTKPFPTSPTAPVQGLAAISSHTLGVCLLALLSDMDIELLPLSTRYHNSELPLLSNSSRKGAHSPLRRLHNEPFHQHIEKILRRNASNPILRSSNTTGLRQQECFELLTRVTHFFREEYILKQDLAREKIEKRIRILREQKKQQEGDLRVLEESRERLRDGAERVAEKYEDIRVTQQATLESIRGVVRKIQSHVPLLSQAEQTMHRELCAMADKLDTYASQLKHVRSKYNHQKKQMEDPISSTLSPSTINTRQAHSLRSVLKQQSDDIVDLVKNVNRLKTDTAC